MHFWLFRPIFGQLSVWASKAALTTGPQKKSCYQSLIVDLYRFFPRFLMASTFLAFSANFWLFECLGCQGGLTNPNTQLAKNWPKKPKMRLPLKIQEKTYINLQLSFGSHNFLSAGCQGCPLAQKMFFFRPFGSDGGGTFRLHFWNLQKIWL